jgi:hypothetical protein
MLGCERQSCYALLGAGPLMRQWRARAHSRPRSLAARVRTLRPERGWTREEIAARAGIALAIYRAFKRPDSFRWRASVPCRHQRIRIGIVRPDGVQVIPIGALGPLSSGFAPAPTPSARGR